jgi:CTP synthase (UTP-ammonia lyase)
MIRLGIIGDFDENKLSHKATNAALHHCAESLSMDLEAIWLPTKSLEGDVDVDIFDYDGFWCAPGSPYRSFAGAINAIRFARENNYPFIGTCGGFQHTVLEYARNVLDITDASHKEYNPDASALFITSLSCPILGKARKIYLKKDTLAYKIYGKKGIEERYNCNFGLNPRFQNMIDESGFHIAGTDANGEARVFELPQNRFYIATLFQPQLSSTPENPHKLILQYLLAAQEFHNKR